jgi:hypothetical protein
MHLRSLLRSAIFEALRRWRQGWVRSAGTKARYRPKYCLLEELEPRTLLSVAVNFGGANTVLTVSHVSGGGDLLTITQSGGSLVLSLTGDTFTTNDPTDVILTNGNTTATINTNSAATPVTQLLANLTQSGDEVTFNGMTNPAGGGVGSIDVQQASEIDVNNPINLTGGIGAGAGGVTLNATNPASNIGGIRLNPGIINGTPSIVTGSGNISLTGDGAVFDSNVFGIALRGATLSTITGDISLNGTGGGGSTVGSAVYDHGVYLYHDFGLSRDTKVTTVSGAITITGTGVGSVQGSTDLGVLIKSGSQVTSTGSGSGIGAITITGMGGFTGGNNQGVLLTDSGTVVSSASGSIQITGTGGGTGGIGGNDGVLVQSSAKVATGPGTGGIDIHGTGGDTSAGIGLSAATIQSANGFILVSGTGTGSAPGTEVTSSSSISTTAVTITFVKDLQVDSGVTFTLTAGFRILLGALTTVLGPTGKIAAANGVQVSSGDELQGNGTVSGAIDVKSGGTVAPGLSSGTGILTGIAGTESFETGSIFSVALDGLVAGTGYDQLNVTGSVNLNSDSGSGSQLSLSGTVIPSVGDVFTIIHTTAGVSGEFDNLAEGSIVTANGFPYQISYLANGGNDVTLTSVPSDPLDGADSATTTVSSGSDNATLPLNPTTLFVASTSNFAPQGTIAVQTSIGVVIFSYDGTTGGANPSFNNVVGGDNIPGATLATGDTVTQTLTGNWQIPPMFMPSAMRFTYRRNVYAPTVGSFQLNSGSATPLQAAASPFTAEQFIGLSLSNPILEADVSPAIGSANISAIGFFARSQSNGDAYVAMLSIDSTGTTETAEFGLFHGASSTFTVLKSAPMTVAATTTLRFTVTGTDTGTTLSLVDVGNGGVSLLSLSGSPLTTLNSAGGVGIFAQGANGTINNFLVGGS